MRILYISQYFPPEVNAPAQRVFDFARAWRNAGHEVVVLTGFPNHPAGVVYDGYKLRPLSRETVDGVEVVRTYLYPAPNKGMARRCMNYGSFMLSASLIGCRAVGKVDVVIASCPQLLVGLAGYAISRAKRAPFILEVRDVWPEALLAVNAGLNRQLYRILDGMAEFLYKRATRIVTVTTGAQDTIAGHGVPAEKMVLIPSGINTDLVKPIEPPQDIRREFGDGDSVIVSYVGTHGMAQKLATVLEAARKLEGDRRIQFVLIGDGAEKQDLVRMKTEMKLGNVHFLDQMPQTDALRYVAASDICVVPLRKAELFTQTIPSKVYEIMACARPFILGVDGEARALTETASAGLFVDPENPDALAAAVLRLADDPESRAAYGRNGRKYAMENYDRKLFASRFLEMITSLTGPPCA